jgi:hypothetical protein
VPDCTVLLLSGEAGSANLMVLDSGHNFTLLQKPVHPSDLLAHLPKRNLELLSSSMPVQ